VVTASNTIPKKRRGRWESGQWVGSEKWTSKAGMSSGIREIHSCAVSYHPQGTGIEAMSADGSHRGSVGLTLGFGLEPMRALPLGVCILRA
jgi:hypothetical protein